MSKLTYLHIHSGTKLTTPSNRFVTEIVFRIFSLSLSLPYFEFFVRCRRKFQKKSYDDDDQEEEEEGKKERNSKEYKFKKRREREREREREKWVKYHSKSKYKFWIEKQNNKKERKIEVLEGKH